MLKNTYIIVEGVIKKMLSKIKKLKNVEILDPSISSLDIIEMQRQLLQ